MNSMNSHLVVTILNEKKRKEKIRMVLSHFRNRKQTSPKISNDCFFHFLLKFLGACKMNHCCFSFGLRVSTLFSEHSSFQPNKFLFFKCMRSMVCCTFLYTHRFVIVTNSMNCLCIRSPYSSLIFTEKEFGIS